ncbi:uncharacterized protein BKA78DRAFT_157266 [Phyllosticta capitalensis]|uniref:uncharacterized protein n=1 Tax=Phyllosticta capitalensis TaxID=121624 RepID=UPI003130096E
MTARLYCTWHMAWLASLAPGCNVSCIGLCSWQSVLSCHVLFCPQPRPQTKIDLEHGKVEAAAGSVGLLSITYMLWPFLPLHLITYVCQSDQPTRQPRDRPHATGHRTRDARQQHPKYIHTCCWQSDNGWRGRHARRRRRGHGSNKPATNSQQ